MKLHDVTLVAIDTVCHDLTAQAIRDTIAHIEFGDVLVFSDRDLGVGSHIPCNVRSNLEAERWMWYGVAPHLNTTHALYIQWDGWVTNPELWRPEFLAYDYIGAAWPWQPFDRVGNGGFSLRSRKLLTTLTNNPDRFPFAKPEDDTLCRRHGLALHITHGIHIAPEAVARGFSYEHGPPHASFGFHGLWNMLRRLPEDEVCRRVSLLPKSYGAQRPDLGYLATLASSMGSEAVLKSLASLGVSI